MRKAVHQISNPFSDLGQAEDSLFAATRMPGVEAAWICPQQRVHFITTGVRDVETLSQTDLQKGQRLVFLPDAAPSPS